MRIGIMLGSFDPIHIGHVSVITQVLNSNIIDMILVVPTAQNPFKVTPPVSFDLRCQMIQSEIDKIDEFYKGRIILHTGEKDIESPNYSYKILAKIRQEFEGDELFIICGTDIIDQIDTWKNFKTDILPFFKYIEIGRNVGFVEDGTFDVDVNGGSINVTRIPNVLHETSSSAIRKMCSNGICPLPLISTDVYKTILNNKLYV